MLFLPNRETGTLEFIHTLGKTNNTELLHSFTHSKDWVQGEQVAHGRRSCPLHPLLVLWPTDSLEHAGKCEGPACSAEPVRIAQIECV